MKFTFRVLEKNAIFLRKMQIASIFHPFIVHRGITGRFAKNAILIPSRYQICAHATCTRRAFLCNFAYFSWASRKKSEWSNYK